MTVYFWEIMESDGRDYTTLTENEVRYFFDSLVDAQSAKFEFTIGELYFEPTYIFIFI